MGVRQETRKVAPCKERRLPDVDPATNPRNQTQVDGISTLKVHFNVLLGQAELNTALDGKESEMRYGRVSFLIQAGLPSVVVSRQKSTNTSGQRVSVCGTVWAIGGGHCQ
jgi:hypothetical protein